MENPQRVFDPLDDSKDGHVLSRAIIDTIREPLIVLDEDLRVVAASRSFYEDFRLSKESSVDKKFYELDGGKWDIPELRTLLEEVIPKHKVVTGYEVSHLSPASEPRTVLINAREIRFPDKQRKMLLSISDVTARRTLELDREKLMAQKDVLLREMRHRIANSLQLIASILILKAETVESKESRRHLEDAHQRILSIATVEQQLDPVGIGEDVGISKYLQGLCDSLERSMIADRKPIKIEVVAGKGSASSDMAISMGLITTELVINSIKHAFPNGKKGEITVTYESDGSAWTLGVRDNGVGHTEKNREGDRGGLGTSIVGALASQLGAVVRTESSPKGTSVSIAHPRE
ncbi:MAG: histidine kinase dimerization/phosphoacceptor domain -containing protein [Minisyncoccia bacterium]